MTGMLSELRAELRRAADPSKAALFPRFYKTGPGEYAEGDRFIGVTVPDLHKLVCRFRELPTADVLRLLASQVHEERSIALRILVERFAQGDDKVRRNMFRIYLANTRHINNWDLVDASAHRIVGAWLDGRDMRTLERLARSKDLWERRIAIVATLHDIRQGRSGPTLRIAELLLHDPHDLIHKATGWMLREVGKRCPKRELESFLSAHASHMPRTMLRYAIEHLCERERQAWLRIGKDRA